MKRQIATIRDVAEAAGVSIATVSAVLNQSARVSPAREARVRRAVAELGYAPQRSARSLRQGKTMMLSLIVPDIANPFFGTIGRIVEREADQRGYALLLNNSGEDEVKERRYLGHARAQDVDGLILSITGPHETYTQDWREHIGVPTVLVDRDIPGLDLECVTTDNRLAAELAVRHLLSLGHRRIGAVLGPDHLSPSLERSAGFEAALNGSDAERDPELFRKADFHSPDAYRKCQALLALPKRPTAIFVANNLMAIGALRAIAEAGLRVPDDLSVVTIDDFEWANAFYPRLTTVSQPLEAIGRRAVERLMPLLRGEGPTAPRRELLEPELIVRDSCAPPARRRRR
ncbi:MAG: LacI family DNA-binding transcriptional regulator [Alphaproteobacteria bacterium]